MADVYKQKKQRSGSATRRGSKSTRVRIIHDGISENASTLGTRPRPPYLFEEFAAGIPAKGPLDKLSRMDRRQMRYTLLQYIEGVPVPRIARDLGFATTSLWEFLKRVKLDPGAFLDCHFMLRFGVGRTKDEEIWFCRYCGDIFKTGGTAADHAFCHLWPREALFDPELR